MKSYARANLKRRGKKEDGRRKQLPEPFGEEERKEMGGKDGR